VNEIDAMCRSVEEDVLLEGSIGENGLIGKLRKVMDSKVVRHGLMASYASNNTVMVLVLITSGLNAICSVISMFFVDRASQRRLMLISLVGIVVWLAVLGGTFLGATPLQLCLSGST
jgi:MFS transporter, SP family, solute carrier family 2 (myo-inositol transporter), member 13